MLYYLFHIPEGRVLENCGWQSKTRWKEWFRNGGTIIWSSEHDLYWRYSSKRAANNGSHPEYYTLTSAELSLVEVKWKDFERRILIDTKEK